MINFDHELLAGHGDLKISYIVKDQRGNYQKCKLHDEDVWVNLQITEDKQLQELLEDVLDQATTAWCTHECEENYIKIPKLFLRRLWAAAQAE